MDIKLSIDVTDKALEFSRNMGSLFVNLGVIDKESMERSANRPVQKALDEHAEKVSHEPPVDAPWNTEPIEPDNLKVETPTKKETKKYSKEELRKLGAQFIQKKGVPAFKKILSDFGITKLGDLKETDQEAFVEAINA
jgi:hypothetical protein